MPLVKRHRHYVVCETKVMTNTPQCIEKEIRYNKKWKLIHSHDVKNVCTPR